MKSSAQLRTSSPGLAMISLGVATVLLSLYSRSSVEIDPTLAMGQPMVAVRFQPAQVEAKGTGTAAKAEAVKPLPRPGAPGASAAAGKPLEQLSQEMPPLLPTVPTFRPIRRWLSK